MPPSFKGTCRSAGEATVTFPLAAVILSKVAVVILVVAGEGLVCVGHPDRVIIGIWGDYIEGPWQEASKAPGPVARDGNHIALTDRVSVGVLDVDGESVVLGAPAGTFILILRNVHATPDSLVGGALLVENFVSSALAGRISIEILVIVADIQLCAAVVKAALAGKQYRAVILLNNYPDVGIFHLFGVDTKGMVISRKPVDVEGIEGEPVLL